MSLLIMAVFLCGCGKNAGTAPEGKEAQGLPNDEKNNEETGSESVASTAKETEAVQKGPAKLLYLGHSSVRIETGEGKIIYIDPYAGEDYSKPADLILVTHYHSDHYGLSKITKNEGCKVIESFDALKGSEYKSFEAAGVKIRAVPAYNGNHKKSECVGYILEFDGIKLYHAGDTSKIVEMGDLAAENLNYALLPMDNVYNMGPEEAAECAEMIKAKHFIPIHTGPNGVFSEENIEKFNVESKLVVKPGEEIELSAE